MVRIKLEGITSFCVAGVVVQPDEFGIAEVSPEVLASDDFASIREQLKPGQSISAAPAVEAANPVVAEEPTEDADVSAAPAVEAAKGAKKAKG